VRLARPAVVAAATFAALAAAPGVASADQLPDAPSFRYTCGDDCGTDAPYGINTTMQQRLAYQTASGSAQTSNWFESAVNAMQQQLDDLIGG